ncbi:MAG: TldD/PmbA family protein [Methylococcales bacterium]|nr:TldD/PmbA family protein [Methylococcales bacterium]
MEKNIVSLFRSLIPSVDFCSLRFVDRSEQKLSVRQGIVEPVSNRTSRGAQITVFHNGGAGYAATCDFSRSGLTEAIGRASSWAEATVGKLHLEPTTPEFPSAPFPYETQIREPWHSQDIAEKTERLSQINTDLKIHDNIVDWWAALYHEQTESLFITAETEIQQKFVSLTPFLGAVASNCRETQKRTWGSESASQAGLEHLASMAFAEQASVTAEDALKLLDARNCPKDCADLLLMPNQMVLQIHESIGHPLELDRILGDERNYAGGSFVTPKMFGHYRYGSDLLNVTFDPTRETQIASYSFDDEGTVSERTFLIRNGILERPIGGYTSQQRVGLPGVAASRACDWNRAPIDRMANINLEPGNSSFTSMVESVEKGILMESNRSWSIDDSRNKFQFGCEIGWVIHDGQIREMIKNPNYRGISSDFWRTLTAVGDASTLETLSVPTCGKGEPNQAVQVGHAAPPCLFGNIDIFGSNE